MVRIVVSTSTNTISTGIAVQANSIGLLPYNCGGSRGSSLGRARKRTMLYSSKPPTARKIAPVIASVNHASVAIALAGVETGLNTAPWAICRFAAPIPQSSDNAGAAARNNTATGITPRRNNRNREKSAVRRSHEPIEISTKRTQTYSCQAV